MRCAQEVQCHFYTFVLLSRTLLDLVDLVLFLVFFVALRGSSCIIESSENSAFLANTNPGFVLPILEVDSPRELAFGHAVSTFTSVFSMSISLYALAATNQPSSYRTPIPIDASSCVSLHKKGMSDNALDSYEA